LFFVKIDVNLHEIGHFYPIDVWSQKIIREIRKRFALQLKWS